MFFISSFFLYGRHENCLEHGQHAGGTIMEHLRNQIMAFKDKLNDEASSNVPKWFLQRAARAQDNSHVCRRERMKI
jgi:hypothetical protein